MIAIRISIWNAGCLRPLLAREIESVERHMRICASTLSADAAKSMTDYLGQLRGVLGAVDEVFDGARRQAAGS